MTDLGHDLERLADALELRFPDLRPVRPLSVLGRGFRSLAVETAGGQVIRVGRLPEAAQDYARQWRIRHFIARHLAGLAPSPAWYAPPCAELPHGALGYAKLAGTPPVWGVHPGARFAHRRLPP
jgi:hypothetical protein